MLLQAVKNLFTSPVFLPQPPVASQTKVDRRNREFFRVDTSIAISYILEQEFVPDRPLETRRVNLSGGGMRLRIPELPIINSLVWLKLALPDQQPFDCLGKVVWQGEANSAGWDVAMEFLDLATGQRDQIIAFCFAEQGRLLRHNVRVA